VNKSYSKIRHIQESNQRLENRFLNEQNDAGFDRRYGTYDAAVKTSADNRVMVDWYKNNAHTVNTVLQIGTAFIPFVGPFISVGIGLADAALYYKEGETKKSGLVAILSVLPVAGTLLSKIPTIGPAIVSLGTKGMAALAVKLSTNKTLNAIEISIVNGLARYAPVITQEAKVLGQKLLQSYTKLPVPIKNVAKTVVDYGKKKVVSKIKNDVVSSVYNNVIPANPTKAPIPANPTKAPIPANQTKAPVKPVKIAGVSKPIPSNSIFAPKSPVI